MTRLKLGANSCQIISQPMGSISSTGERPASQAHQEIINEAKRLEETTLYSMKGHHCAARGWSWSNLWLGLPIVIISAIASAAAFTQAAKDYSSVAVLAGILSTIVSVLAAINTFLNPKEKENAHLSAAHAFDKLNNDARLFWSIECWQSAADETLTEKLRTLVGRKNELNANSPQIPDWAYRKAKKGIAAGEASFQVDVRPSVSADNS
jgi:hypothetical protein